MGKKMMDELKVLLWAALSSAILKDLTSRAAVKAEM